MSVVEAQGDSESRILFFFSRTAGRTGAPSDYFSRTLEKLARTLEPWSHAASSMMQTVTIFSGQSVISRVYTHITFWYSTARLEPRPRCNKKKVPGTVTS